MHEEAKSRKAESIYYTEKLKWIQAQVPEQPNNDDCGVYLLHNIEQFFENTNETLRKLKKDNKILKDWFEHSVITRKRKSIKELLISLKVNGEVQYRSTIQ